MQSQYDDLISIAARIVRNDDDIPLQRRAISVFDKWLGPENLHLLDCKNAEERNERNRPLLSFWEAIYDAHTLLVRTENGAFVAPTDRDSYLDKCQYDPDRESDRFQCIILPELLAIYREDWDDTNVLWFRERELVSPLLSTAVSCGLYVIEYQA